MDVPICFILCTQILDSPGVSANSPPASPSSSWMSQSRPKKKLLLSPEPDPKKLHLPLEMKINKAFSTPNPAKRLLGNVQHLQHKRSVGLSLTPRRKSGMLPRKRLKSSMLPKGGRATRTPSSDTVMINRYFLRKLQ